MSFLSGRLFGLDEPPILTNRQSSSLAAYLSLDNLPTITPSFSSFTPGYAASEASLTSKDTSQLPSCSPRKGRFLAADGSTRFGISTPSGIFSVVMPDSPDEPRPMHDDEDMFALMPRERLAYPGSALSKEEYIGNRYDFEVRDSSSEAECNIRRVI